MRAIARRLACDSSASPRLSERRAATTGERFGYSLFGFLACAIGLFLLFGSGRVISRMDGSSVPTALPGAILLGYGVGLAMRAAWIAPFAAAIVAWLVYQLGGMAVSIARWAAGAGTWPSFGRTPDPGTEAGLAIMAIAAFAGVAFVVAASAFDVLAERRRVRRG